MRQGLNLRPHPRERVRKPDFCEGNVPPDEKLLGSLRPIADMQDSYKLGAMRTLRPTTAAKWLLVSYALAILAIFLFTADAIDVLIFGTLLGVPWIVAPAAIAALLVSTWEDPIVTWGSLAIEGAVIGFTAWVAHTLVAQPDPQNGIFLMLLPMLQSFGVVLCLMPLLVLQRVIALVHRPKR